MNRINYRELVIKPTLLSMGSWTLNDEIKYYNSSMLGTYKVIYKTIGNDQIVNFNTLDEMIQDISNNIFNNQ
jgi:replication initiation and membrane attachment protein DnaB